MNYKIEIARHAGFCFGVKRAYDMVLNALKTDDSLYMLGDLIHNKQVVNELKDKGAKVIENLDGIENGTLVIRAHGISIEELNIAQKKGFNIVDATCPYVKIPQKAAQKLSDEDYFIILVGDKGHPEVDSIVSYLKKDNFIITKKTSDLTYEFFKKNPKIGVIAQTTLPLQTLQDIITYSLNYAKEINIINSICDATFIRQEETLELARNADCMIILGGKHSANTTRLKELASVYCSNTHHIESEQELKNSWFENVNHIGISAGASTPDAQIEIVRQYIISILEENSL
ncbi:4-hydroxy-3-methylbut-2-enyl diphosphate reductase [bacterium]|nr:4-hydroxy-3-methylbut-2-enyl diphosphate reductase [bacterium]